jgi:uncharacterized protein (TIGR02996 family)
VASDELAQALAALDAGRDDEALAAVAAAWRTCRAPELAELAELLARRSPPPLSRALATLFTARVEASLANLERLGEVDHPLLASFVLQALVEPPFTGPSAQPLLAALVGQAARLCDPRLTARAAAIGDVWRLRVTPKPARVALMAELMHVAERLAAHPPAPLSDGERALVTTLTARLDRVAATGRTAAELYAAVFAAPEEDAPRLVLADFLLEQGDPRGELIMLQFKRRDQGLDEREHQREAALLKQHGRAWLGPLATVLSWGKRYSNTRFERGFVAVADVMDSANKKLQLVARDPHWATVEELRGMFVGQLLETAPLRGLKRLGLGAPSLSPERLQRLADDGQTLPLRELYLGQVPSPSLLRRVLPRLAVLTVYPPPEPSLLDELLRLPLERLVIDHAWSPRGISRDEAEAHAALVAAIEARALSVPEVAVQPPWQGRPKPPPIELRRDGDGRYRRRG